MVGRSSPSGGQGHTRAVSRLRSNDPCWCGSGRKWKRCHGAFARRSPVEPGVVGSLRTVPPSIDRPPYIATGGQPGARPGPQIIDFESLPRLRHACQVAATVLLEAGRTVRPGVTTAELDAVAHEAYVSRGAYPSTLGYRDFPASVCLSVNEVACHGIPDSRALQEGDIVNIDVTAYIGGMHGDTSATFAVGAVDASTAALVGATCTATDAGIAAIAPGRSVRVIGQAIEPIADRHGFGVITRYGGHGIGAVFHADPHVNHVDDRKDTAVFVPGMALTVEPMFTAGTTRLEQWPDGWTEVTADGLPSAQFEHTVIVTADGVEVLTVTADGETAVCWPNG
ncbi:MAG: map [Ilumatobacteraceae bacterium]|nr:map [Ilumatobacteraceae bacterium]